MTTKLQPQTALERNVARWANARAAEYNNGLEGVFKDLFYGGCQSGMVGHLIYHKDTLAFYRKHRAEIQQMFTEMVSEFGENILRGWDYADPFALDTNNRNLLAWFGFEEAARHLCDRAEIDA